MFLFQWAERFRNGRLVHERIKSEQEGKILGIHGYQHARSRRLRGNADHQKSVKRHQIYSRGFYCGRERVLRDYRQREGHLLRSQHIYDETHKYG